jgi:hypothetical protein
MIDTPMPAPFLMVYSGRVGRAGARDLIYRRSASKYYRVDVKDTIDPARAAEITRTIVREFFGQEY